MFVLKKILNSAQSTPECIKIKAKATETYIAGMPLKIGSTGCLENISSVDKPTHISCESAAPGEKSLILCYRITEDMIFSAIASEDMTAATPGTKVALSSSDDGYACLISSSTEDAVATVINNCGAKSAGDRLLISF